MVGGLSSIDDLALKSIPISNTNISHVVKVLFEVEAILCYCFWCPTMIGIISRVFLFSAGCLIILLEAFCLSFEMRLILLFAVFSCSVSYYYCYFICNF